MTYSKVKISGIIELKSGLHIGTSNAFAAIGATNNPIIKDPLTNLPYIPGSTLKGKMRSLLYRTDYNSNTTEKLSKDSLEISRLFGNSETYKIGRLVFRDAFLNNKEELGKRVSTYTEVKFENTINRITAEATPRQVERAIRESEFAFEIIYSIQEKELTEVEKDMEILKAGFELLEWDYLGGSGSRGYGKVCFKNFEVKTVFGEFDKDKIIEALKPYTKDESDGGGSAETPDSEIK